MEASNKSYELQTVTSDNIPFDYLCGTAECLKVIAHPVRLQIILYMMKGEFTVDEISKHCDLSHAQTSGHLRLMEGKGLLNRERRGRTVVYSILEPHLIDVMECINGRYVEMKANLKRQSR